MKTDCCLTELQRHILIEVCLAAWVFLVNKISRSWLLWRIPDICGYRGRTNMMFVWEQLKNKTWLVFLLYNCICMLLFCFEMNILVLPSRVISVFFFSFSFVLLSCDIHFEIASGKAVALCTSHTPLALKQEQRQQLIWTINLNVA